MIGSAVAFELARAGKRVVVDRRLPAAGSGSTSASSSIIRYSYTTRDPILTSWEAAQMWFDWEAHLGWVDPDGMARFIECANLIFQTTGYDGTPILPFWDEFGIEYELLSPDEYGGVSRCSTRASSIRPSGSTIRPLPTNRSVS